MASYIRDEPCLGIKSVRWSPSSQFLAIGSYDQKLRLLNNYTWKPSIEFAHPVSVDAVDIVNFRGKWGKEVFIATIMQYPPVFTLYPPPIQECFQGG